MSAPTTPPKILLDCDPGLDDIFAMFCAFRYCDLRAITTVAGNVALEHTTHNALGITALAKAMVPVHSGASRPLNGSDAVDARHVHGESGLGGIVLPTFEGDIASNDAVTALFDETAAHDVTVVAVGPLTNIALAIQRDPSWISRVPRLVIMGGSTHSGNVTPYAEFNIWADPEAAAVVFDSGVAITMAGLNLTRQVHMGAVEIATMRDSGTPTGVIAADGLDFYSDFSLANYGVKESAMHDPCAVMEVARPDLFGRAAMQVSVETAGDYTRGMTVCDQRPNAADPDTDVLVDADRDALVALIVDAASEPNPSDTA